MEEPGRGKPGGQRTNKDSTGKVWSRSDLFIWRSSDLPRLGTIRSAAIIAFVSGAPTSCDAAARAYLKATMRIWRGDGNSAGRAWAPAEATAGGEAGQHGNRLHADAGVRCQARRCLRKKKPYERIVGVELSCCIVPAVPSKVACDLRPDARSIDKIIAVVGSGDGDKGCCESTSVFQYGVGRAHGILFPEMLPAVTDGVELIERGCEPMILSFGVGGQGAVTEKICKAIPGPFESPTPPRGIFVVA